MVLSITQETYDSVVCENMEVFEMSPEEAIYETIQQFKAQGADLSLIVTHWMLATTVDCPALTSAVSNLDKLVKSSATDSKKCVVELEVIRIECQKGLSYQVLAGKEGAYQVIMGTMLKYESDDGMTKECLKTFISLMTKQPDLLDDSGIKTIIRYMDQKKDPEVLSLVLKWVKECCIMHELNRQQIFDADILGHLKSLLNKANSAVLCDVLAVLRALVLDDDVRVEFGRAHEHARTIASDTLCAITGLLGKFKKDEVVMGELMLTLSSLLVRNEFCKKLEDAGGLKVVQDAMVDFQENDKLIKQCLKLVKSLAGNDECKVHIIQNGAAPVIVSVMDKHKKSVQTAIFGLASVAALTLRSPENSKALFDAGIADVIVDIMALYPDNENVQKNGSWAIRNMVSRSRYQCGKFLELGIETILKNALKKFKKSDYDIKAALRDLGCQVELKEEWTGKGGRLNTQTKK